MMETSCFSWLPILILTQNFGFSGGILVEKWIEQYQDHFDYYNGGTWLMRYYENDEFYHQSGPIFIMIGGEHALMPLYVEDSTSFMYQMAQAHRAMMYAIEHRYYGKSHPVPDTSSENLRYLNVLQTLADIALFIEIKKKELNSSNAFTMVFGSSYAGNLAAWMRVEYPNLVQGALASSAPVYVKADFAEYYEFVENSIRKYDENCAINIKEAFSALEELLKNPVINSIKLKNDFKLCTLQDFSQLSEIPYMILALANIFGHAILYNRISMNGKKSIENLCNIMTENEAISPYYRLVEVFKIKFLANNSCMDLKYSNSLEEYRQTSWESTLVEVRLWTYQTCTELGYYQTPSSPESIFGSLVPLQYFVNWCKDLFAESFNSDNLNHNIRIINLSYNSKLSNTKNIIFTNGDLDPWSSLSVLADLNPASPAILINGASHGGFLNKNEATLMDSIVIARCEVSFIIYEWLYLSNL